ncbi:hypothetical protein HPB52_019181 [Rhipicephalus sanguineus]|uniref:Uncharacterized protein n=1 Tax=Rhipicephalus sanguineus TaxID=34632 RepID=A0A9D4QDW2_RHISA|nr:hypothetical protein HPB52_019181 [Rhipicephalus sanguineus]
MTGPPGGVEHYEDSKDTKFWDLDPLHEKVTTSEETRYTDAANNGFGRRRGDARTCGVWRRVCVLFAHMEVDEELPGPSRESENHPNDASSVSQEVESSNEARASSDASLDNEKDDDEGLSRTWTEDGWHTVLSRRRKKNSKKTQKEPEKGMEKKNEEPPANPPETPRPTASPEGRHKIILRPHKGLTVKNLLGSALSMAVTEACRNTFGGDSFLLRVHPGSNIVIMSAPREEVAGMLREISQLKIRGQIHSFNACVADPEDVLRGIVHGLPPGTTQADLMANLRIRTQGVNTERARMLGSSKSAIITFTGNVLPRGYLSPIQAYRTSLQDLSVYWTPNRCVPDPKRQRLLQVWDI